jgi:hypothetical protein
MKLTLLLALLLIVAVLVTINARKRRALEAQAAAQARQRAARRNRVPEVSSNLKGVTASQTVSPYRPGESRAPGDERVA